MPKAPVIAAFSAKAIPEPPEELGSSLPEPPEEEFEEEDVDETAPEAPPEAVIPTLEAPEIDPKAEWIDDR